MNKGEAVAIFQDIWNDDRTDEEKGLAIILVSEMETHNSVTKNQMLEVIKWLWSRSFELRE